MRTNAATVDTYSQPERLRCTRAPELRATDKGETAKAMP